MVQVSVVDSLNLPEQQSFIGRLKVGDTTVFYTRIPLDMSDLFSIVEGKPSSISVVLESTGYLGIGRLYCEGRRSLYFDPVYNGYGKKPGVSDSDLPWFMKPQAYSPKLYLNESFDFRLPEGLKEGPIISETFFDLYPDKTVFFPIITESRIKAYYESVGVVAKSF